DRSRFVQFPLAIPRKILRLTERRIASLAAIAHRRRDEHGPYAACAVLHGRAGGRETLVVGVGEGEEKGRTLGHVIHCSAVSGSKSTQPALFGSQREKRWSGSRPSSRNSSCHGQT